MFTPYLIAIGIAVFAALGFSLYNYLTVKKLKEGTAEMSEIAAAIREGASAFLLYEFKIVAITAVAIAVVLGAVLDWYVGVSFFIGTVMSELAAFVGLKIATYANVRVTNEAKNTKSVGKTLKVAFRGGSVMGLCVAGFGLAGMLLIYLIFGVGMRQTDPSNVTLVTNWLTISYIPFTMSVTGYSLGCSVVALFNRVGGGIYTKAADMGADLVGKTEAHIPEDDPRNPATIADNVGDNVGDVAGLGSDLLESYIGAIISCVVLAAYMYYTRLNGSEALSPALLSKLMVYPIIFSALGLAACVIGVATVLLLKVSDNAHRTLNISLWLSAAIIIVGGGAFTYFFFRGENVTMMGFKAGALSTWVAAIIGIVAGIVIGLFAEYYTSDRYKPTKRLANASQEGVALTITGGMALGMKSCLPPVLVLAAALIGSDAVAGIYGVAMAAIGMLSFVGATVSVDTYGPIADNAGGIAEMAGLDSDVREITDKLDSVGNTTAAIGKGFAIGSAALAALSLLVSYMHAQMGMNESVFEPTLNIIDALSLAGAFVGGVLPYLFSGMLIDAVTKSAGKMVSEVRRQFDENPGILDGTVKPDYKRCITISVGGAIGEMKVPVIIAVAVPIVSGFLLGAQFVGGILIGATLSAIMLAVYTANCGGAWDNAKKFIEAGGIKGFGKNSSVHDAAVVGDTVGDPLKDTVGPSLDILIKIMATVSLITVSIFGKFNLLSLIG